MTSTATLKDKPCTIYFQGKFESPAKQSRKEVVDDYDDVNITKISCFWPVYKINLKGHRNKTGSHLK